MAKTKTRQNRENDATISVDATAKILKIGRAQAYAAANRGDIPCIRIGKRLLVLRVPLMRMLAGEVPAREVKAG